jgi:hypothetical protein
LPTWIPYQEVVACLVNSFKKTAAWPLRAPNYVTAKSIKRLSGRLRSPSKLLQLPNLIFSSHSIRAPYPGKNEAICRWRDAEGGGFQLRGGRRNPARDVGGLPSDSNTKTVELGVGCIYIRQMGIDEEKIYLSRSWLASRLGRESPRYVGILSGGQPHRAFLFHSDGEIFGRFLRGLVHSNRVTLKGTGSRGAVWDGVASRWMVSV